VRQAIRFCTSFDGTRIAYAVTGNGPPLVKAPHWLTHLEYEFASPLWRPWIEGLSRSHRLLRMDARGCGLSDWEVPELSLEAYARDLEAVVAAAGFESFALLGHSQGAAIGIEYAARHPERVTHLVILGGYARGVLHRGLSAARLAEYEALLKLVEAGWGREDGAYRRMFAMQFAPGSTLEQINAMSELQRAASSPQNTPNIIRSHFDIDVTASAPRVRCPTLVMHAQDDGRIPFEEGRLIATLVPDARFVTLKSSNHILLEQEPAFAEFFAQLSAFVPPAAGAAARQAFGALTRREADILERIAQGLDNAQIAAHFGLSQKTVRNNITRIFDKLQVANRSQAIVLAREHGLGKS
jgi:pimeloyl-ACP methyl ester carboxylesterase/DNA-binding CsgD family transcriptional regulator